MIFTIHRHVVENAALLGLTLAPHGLHRDSTCDIQGPFGWMRWTFAPCNIILTAALEKSSCS